MMTCCLDETTGRGIEFPPLTSVDAAWQHPNRINLRAIFSRDMKASAFIQRSVERLPLATSFWLVHGMPFDADVSVSGRTIG